MTAPEPRPPALARRLLRWAAGRLRIGELADDADELFVERARSRGERRARRWYRRQALAALRRSLLPGGGRTHRSARTKWLSGVSLDAKLGVRMLARYPGLTLVGGLAMAFAIFVGAATFEFVDQMVDPTLPLADGERIVGLRYWDRAENEEELPLPDDLRTWRESLSTVEDLGGFQTVERNLSVGGEVAEPVQLARISAVGFRVADVQPLLGRTLVEGDEEPGAPPVAVLGHRIWRVRFGSDPAVVGRMVRLEDVQTTVVGVMPEGFAFPRDHGLWTPLRLEDLGSDGGRVATLRVFGRLAPGATLEEARAEMSALAAPRARRAAEADRRLTAEVLPYWESLYSNRIGPLLRAMLYQLNVYPALFLVLVCGNIALLVFARATTRSREIVVRSALGASRRRIVSQLFIEALVLGTLATTLGLAATGPALGWVLDELREIGGAFPFWVDADVSATTVFYAFLLTLLGAVVAGALPALKVTGRGMEERLHQAGAGAGGFRLGGIWTAVVVVQVATTVVFAGVAWVVGGQAARNASVRPFFPAEQYLGLRVGMDRGEAVRGTPSAEDDFLRIYAAAVADLENRIAGHSAVRGVTLADRLPVQARGLSMIELDGGGGSVPPDARRPGHRVRRDAVDLDFFDVFRRRVVAGRALDARDLAEGANAVVVNASFVQEVLGGRSAVGRRIRYLHPDRPGEPGEWHEIVGVVQDLVADQMRAMSGFEDPPKARVYHALDADHPERHPLLYVIVHAPGGPESLGTALHEMAQAVGPSLRLHQVQTLDRVDGDIALLWRLFAYLVLLMSGVALFLSLAGIYAVMSFTVSRRTREIGVRVALGAKGPRVVAEIFRRPAAQVGAGVAIGCLLMAALVWRLTHGGVTVRDAALLLSLGVGMLGVCSLACVVPTLRALRVEPAEALSAEG